MLLKDSISTKLLKMGFVAYVCVAVVVTFIQLITEYVHIDNGLRNEIVELSKTFDPVLEDALWKVDEEAVKSALFGIQQLDSILGVKILDERGRLFDARGLVLNNDGQAESCAEGGRRNNVLNPFEKIFCHHVPLYFNDAQDKKTYVGDVFYYSGRSVVLKKIKYGFFLIVVNSTICATALWFLFLFFVKKIIRKPFFVMTNAIESIGINNSEQKFKLPMIVNPQLTNRRDEIGLLTNTFNFAISNLNESREKEQDRLRLEAIAITARQVAHDIRSPLVALSVAASDLKEVAEEKRLLIRSAVQRIQDIANDLARKKVQGSTCSVQRENANAEQFTENGPRATENVSAHLLSAVIESLVSEKRIQYRRYSGISIEANLGSESYGLFAKIYLKEFKRILSNLVNNAVEAFEKEGRISVSLSNVENMIEIKLQDNGKGIPADILPQLMQEGKSFGKEKHKDCGAGLGLYHAKKMITEWGGDVCLDSEVGKGTTATMTLPRADVPDWFVSSLTVTDQHHVIILDDDEPIHRIWQNRLNEMGHPEDQVHHFNDAEQLLSWYRAEGLLLKKLHTQFLFDYELLGTTKTGLDVVEELGIGPETILVTSHYEEDDVRARCKKLGVKLLPKNLAGFVPIKCASVRSCLRVDVENTISNVSDDLRTHDCIAAILIDDDELIHTTWRLTTESQGKRIAGYKTPQEFFAHAHEYSADTPVYIDSNLSDNVKGEVVAKDIQQKGFKRIYLATGSAPSEFPPMPWVTAIVGKTPPFVK